MDTNKKIYFVTDAHFGARAEFSTRDNEKLFCRFVDSIRNDCGALCLMGDMIDFWYEYKRVVPKGFVRFFSALSSLTDAGVPVYWFAGNHDAWLYSYVQEELGVVVFEQPMDISWMGRRFHLAHGDGLCDSGCVSRFLHHFFHSRVNRWLFSHLLPISWGMAFGQAWSAHSYQKRKKSGEAAYLGEDKEHLIRYAKADVAARGADAADYYVFGHRHIVLDMELANRSRVLILGDWMREFSYGVFDGENFEIDFFENRSVEIDRD